MSYDNVMRFAREYASEKRNTDWLKVLKGCYEEAKSLSGNRFAGSWVYNRQRVGWFPNLLPLVEYGILKKVAQTSSQTFYVMLDIDGVARALQALGYL